LKGAGGGYILFGYERGASYIHFFNKKYKKEITRAFIEEIKQNPQDWKITIEDKRNAPFIAKPMVANPEDNQVVKHKSGRRHNRGYQWYDTKPGFSDDEWTEIESAINSNQKQEKNQKQPKTPQNQPHNPEPKEKPVENKTINNFPNSQSEIISLLLQYFQKEKIKRIILTDEENLKVEYENGDVSTNYSLGNIDQEKIKNYLQSMSDKTISLRELELNNNSDTTTIKPQDNNSALPIVLGISGILTVIVIFVFRLRKNRIKKH